jgi:hypothetical protein
VIAEKPAKLYVTYQDERGKSEQAEATLASPVSRAAALARAAFFRGIVNPLSGCYPTQQKVQYTQKVVSPAPHPTQADPGSDARIVGVFIFATATDSERAVIVVPSFDTSKTLTTGPLAGIAIDQADADVAAFVAEIISGPYTTISAADLAKLNAAYIQIRP